MHSTVHLLFMFIESAGNLPADPEETPDPLASLPKSSSKLSNVHHSSAESEPHSHCQPQNSSDVEAPVRPVPSSTTSANRLHK